jgi:hypothetical protein
VFTAYDRPQYFHSVMNSWAAVRGFHDWHPQVFLEPGPNVDVMTAIAQEHGVKVHRNTVKLGVLRNPWQALQSAFRQGADFAVLAEDDILVSSDVLEYFTWAATELREERVLAACSCSFTTSCPLSQDQLVVTHQEFCPLVWGTWRDRWLNVLRHTWDHDYSSGTPQAPQSGWDWNINLRVMKDWRIVSPIASRATHIGAEGGTHTTAASFPSSVAPTFHPDRPPGPFHLAPADM